MDFEALRRRFAEFRIGVMGDVMLDRYIFGEVERISPEAPVPVLDVLREAEGPGGAANVAVNLAAGGARAHLFGVVGRDKAGSRVSELLEGKGVVPHLVEDPSRPTTVKTRVIARNQHLLRMDAEEREHLDEGVAGELLAGVEEVMRGEGLDAVVLEDYDKGVLSPGVIARVKDIARGGFTAADPKRAHFREYTGVGLLKPNKKEFLGFAKLPGEARSPQDEIRALARAVAETARGMGIGAFLLTLGEEGAIAFDGERVFHIPALRREVYDVTGAGDTVMAYATLGLVAGLDLVSAALLASVAGGIKVSKFGAVPVSAQEVATVTAREWEGLVAKVKEVS